MKALVGTCVLRHVLFRLSLTALTMFLAVVASCGIANATVTGCPKKAISLADAEKLVVRFTEDATVPEFCQFEIADFTLFGGAQPFTKLFNEPDGKTESDRFTTFNTGLLATFCFASDPSLDECQKGTLSTQIAEGVNGLTQSYTFEGLSSGIPVKFELRLSSDGTNGESNGSASDSLMGSKATEPGTLTLLGIGASSVAMFWLVTNSQRRKTRSS